MKKLVFSLILLLPSLCYSQDNIRLAAGEWEPYIGKDLKHSGFITRLVKQALLVQGIELELDFLPWQRSFNSTKNGAYDGSFMWYLADGQERHFLTSEPLIESANVFFFLRSNPFSWSQRNKAKLGLLRAWTILDEETFASLEYVMSEEQNFNKMFRGRIDVLYTDQRAGYYALAQQFPKSTINLVDHYQRPNTAQSYRLILNRNKHQNTRLMSKFNAGLQQLRDDGSYERFLLESELADFR